MRNIVGQQGHILSRLRVNASLFDSPSMRRKKQRGRARKYGDKLGNATTLAKPFTQYATSYSVNLYGKQRNVSAYDNIVMLKTLKCAVRVIWVYRKSQWVALFTTDLESSFRYQSPQFLHDGSDDHMDIC